MLGANDGLVSTSALMMGVGAGSDNLHTLLLSGVAGLVVRALMRLTDYSVACSGGPLGSALLMSTPGLAPSVQYCALPGLLACAMQRPPLPPVCGLLPVHPARQSSNHPLPTAALTQAFSVCGSVLEQGGSLSMACGEFISVASQRDAEKADICKEIAEQQKGAVAQVPALPWAAPPGQPL